LINEIKEINLNAHKPKVIPDPILLKCEGPVKGLKILSENNLMLIGLDSGMVKVVDKLDFTVHSSQQLVEGAPILRIEQILHAVLIQYKDMKGTLIVCKFPEKRNGYKLEKFFEVETMAAGFTTFAATSLVAQDYKNHITLVTMNEEQP
jgi:hypothetical protein